MKQELAATYLGYGWVAAANFAGYLLGNLILLVAIGRVRRPLVLNALSFGVMAGSTIAVGLCSSLPAVAACRFVNALAQAAVLVLTVSLTLAVVPVRLRGRISGLTWMGAALGVTLCGIAAPASIGLHPLLPWRLQWIVMGLVSLAVIPGFSTSIRSAQHATATMDAAETNVVVRPFILLCVVYACFGAGFVLLFTYFTAFVRGLGIPSAHIGFAWALAGVCGIAGAVLWGRAHDALAGRNIIPLPLGLAAVGVLAIASQKPLLIVAGAIVALSSTFGFAGLLSAVARRYVGGAAFPTMFTVATIAFAIGQIAGAPLGGALGDRYGLTAVMSAAAVAYALGALIAMALSHRRDARIRTFDFNHTPEHERNVTCR